MSKANSQNCREGYNREVNQKLKRNNDKYKQVLYSLNFMFNLKVCKWILPSHNENLPSLSAIQINFEASSISGSVDLGHPLCSTNDSLDVKVSARIIRYALFSKADGTIIYFYSTHGERCTFLRYHLIPGF